MGRTLTIVFLALLFLGCGEDKVEDKAYPKGPKVNPATLARQKAMAAQTAAGGGKKGPTDWVLVPNDRWNAMRPFVDKFSGAMDINKSDPFRVNLTRFVELPEITVIQPEVMESTGDEEVKVVLTPLQRYPIEDFELVLIMSGTSIAKAVVLDPLGVPWIVSKDTPIGDKNGVVQTITQYSMVVVEPNVDTPSEINIRPVILDAAAELGATGQAEFAARPLTSMPVK